MSNRPLISNVAGRYVRSRRTQPVPPDPWDMSRKEFLDWDPPKPDPGYRTAYHYTTSNELARSIAREGVRLDKMTAPGGVIWAFQDYDKAPRNKPLIWFQVPKDDPLVREVNLNHVTVRRDVKPEDILLADLAYDGHLMSDMRMGSLAEAAWEHYQKDGNRIASDHVERLRRAYEELSPVTREVVDWIRDNTAGEADLRLLMRKGDFSENRLKTATAEIHGSVLGEVKRPPFGPSVIVIWDFPG